MTMKPPPAVFRFAPSPNGALHLGHAFSAILNHEMASRIGGRFLVRMEDIDQTRCSLELERAMLDDLSWLGLNWEELVLRQSERFTAYQKMLDQLEQAGLCYRSYLTRGDVKQIVRGFEVDGKQWPRDPDGTPHFPGRTYEHRANAQDGYSVRLDMSRAKKLAGDLQWIEIDAAGNQTRITADPAQWGDIALARRDVPTSYHLSVVVDDAFQSVTHVVRGRDLYQATSVHVLLQKLLGLPQPLYHHHRLILDSEGKKLSKSDRDISLAALRRGGATPDDIRRQIDLFKG